METNRIMNNLQLGIRRLRYEVRNLIADYPPVYLPLARLKSGTPAAQVVDDATELLIEAWPRSGNTFAEQAFRMSQRGEVRLAHHFHAPAQVIAAVARKLPVLVIVRDPVDAVCSFVMREPAIGLHQALRGWIRFHIRIMDYDYGYLTATFGQVTSDFGRVTRRLNRRFGTRFGVFQHNPANVEACFSAIERNNRQRFGGGQIVESGIARPSAARQSRKRHIEDALGEEPLAQLVRRARELYACYRSRADDG